MRVPDHIDVEYIDDEEYVHLVNALNAAEQKREHEEPVAEQDHHQVGSSCGRAHGACRGVVDIDLEDVGLVYNRAARFRRHGLKVTDISASEWCQQQVAFSLSAALPRVWIPPLALSAALH